MPASQPANFNLQEFSDTGLLLFGGRLYTYAYGTTAQKTAYTDPAGAVPHTYTADGAGGQYIALNARGELPAPLYLATGSYDIVLKRADGSTVWTRRADPTGDIATSLAGPDGVALVGSAADKRALAASGGAGLVGFTLTGVAAAVGGTFVKRTMQEKESDIISLKDAGAKGDWIPALADPGGKTGAGSAGAGTDDTLRINMAAAACRVLGKALFIPDGGYRATDTLDFSNIEVFGSGSRQAIFYFGAAQVDVIKTTGTTRLRDFGIHGGWDGVTAGQNGNAVLSKYPDLTSYSYNVHCKNLFIQFPKRGGIVYDRAGYSSILGCKINACGLHAMELAGYALPEVGTTVEIGGMTIASDCPNGYGLVINQGQNIKVDGVISEYTAGIFIGGNDNRSIQINEYYQENTRGNLYLSSTGSGVGLTVTNSFGGGHAIQELPNWLNVDIGRGCSNLVEPSSNANEPRTIINTGAEAVTAVAFTGSFTGATLVVPPGAFQLFATMQASTASGGGVTVMTEAAFQVTTDVAATGRNTATNAAYNECSDIVAAIPGNDAPRRLKASVVFRNATGANVTLYLRAYIATSAGQVATKCTLRAVKI